MKTAALEPIEEMITREYRRVNARLASKEAEHLSTPLKSTLDEIHELRGQLKGLSTALAIVLRRRDENELNLEGRLL